MLIQLRLGDDSNPIERLMFGTVDAGTISAPMQFLTWNNRPAQITGELLGEGDGTRVAFPTGRAPLVNHTNAPVSVFVNGSPASGVAVDHENGQIVFSQAPASGVAVTATYWYGGVSNDAQCVAITARQMAQWAGDNTTKKFTLPTRCSVMVSVRVGGAMLAPGEYELQDGNTSLYIPSAPAANVAVSAWYVDSLVQAGYFECRSSGLMNPLNVSGVSDDAEAAYYPIGGMLTRANHLVGTGNGTNKDFNTGTPLIFEVTGVTVGGSPVADYTVNTVSGVIQFVSPPANNAEVRASYRYERAHRVGNIKQWTARKAFVRVNVPFDGPNESLAAQIRVVAQ